jgi:hypothetical protein
MITNWSFHLYMFLQISKYNCKYLCISSSTSMRNYTSNGLLTFHHQPPWMFSQFIIILNGYFQFFLSTSMDIFIFHHQIQWIFSHFIIILNGYFRISLLTIIRNYPYITILTCVTYDNVLPFKPCGI